MNLTLHKMNTPMEKWKRTQRKGYIRTALIVLAVFFIGTLYGQHTNDRKFEADKQAFFFELAEEVMGS